MAENIEGSIKQHIADFCAYSIALDETHDLTNTAQLAVFIRGVTENFDVTEELAAVKPMKGKTTGADFMHQLSDVMKNLGLRYDNLCGITTDGAPALVGSNNGLIAKIKQDMEVAHIHQENLCAKSLCLTNVMS